MQLPPQPIAWPTVQFTMISHNDIFQVRSDWPLLFGWTELHSALQQEELHDHVS